jgi:hypothetical protein
MPGIGEKTISTIKDHIGDLCEAYRVKIENAYLGQEKDLKVNFSVDLSPGKHEDEIIVTTAISFTESKIKDKIESTVDERQMTFEDEK